MNSKQSNIFKGGLQEISEKILIGGMDQKDLPTKENISRQLFETAQKEAVNKAKDIIKNAEEKAKAIEEEALNSMEALKKQAYDEGFNAGYKEGLAKINQQLSSVLIDGDKILEAIEKERRECFEDEEERMFKIICLIAKKITHKDLGFSPEAVKEFIKSCVNKLDNKSTVNIFVNPKTATKLTELKSMLIEENPGLMSLSITADPNLQNGDLMLESNRERLDFRLDSQIEELLATLIS
jgi:flagellar assembly protein FliH